VGQSLQESEPRHAKSIDLAQVSEPSNLIIEPGPVAPLRRSLKWVFWGSMIALTAATSAVVGAALTLMTPLPTAIAPQAGQPLSVKELWQKSFGFHVSRPVNILVLGMDEARDGSEKSEDVFSGRSDTILLVRIDPANNTASILSIPRDTRVRIPEAGIRKINHANVEGGPQLAAEVVSNTLNGVTIDRYVRVSTSAFREMVDLLGGVEVYVPTPMKYVDNTQKLTIDLEPGNQVLNGDQAEQFARFRHDGNGDIGRVQRQQQLIRALRERITNPAVITKLPEAIALFQKYIDTNLSLEEMLALANFGLNLERDDFRMVMLPGRFSSPSEYVASYWIMDREGRDQVMGDYFGMSSVASVDHREVDQLRIAVQNASGEPNMARQVVNLLRDRGFNDVYLVQDWPAKEAQTQIIVQRGDLQGAASLETILGLGAVIPASTGDLDSDLTIRVGADWVDQIDDSQL
jgi:polyisoprenyl-teichoic acid--peptidoglycan teichoic acid transferase